MLVDVLVVSPGFVATDIRQRALGANGQPLGQSPRDESKCKQNYKLIAFPTTALFSKIDAMPMRQPKKRSRAIA
jgi:hypothetical protein